MNVYKECTQGGGGGTPTGGGPAAGANGDGSNTTAPPFSGPTANALNHAGKDKNALTSLVRAYGLRRHLQASQSGSTSPPSSVGSALDLGPGPTALLIALAGTALLLLGGSGVRVWRNRHRA